MGFLMAGPALVLVIASSLFPSIVPENISGTMFVVAVVLVVYTGVLGVAGASVGGYLALRTRDDGAKVAGLE